MLIHLYIIIYMRLRRHFDFPFRSRLIQAVAQSTMHMIYSRYIYIISIDVQVRNTSEIYIKLSIREKNEGKNQSKRVHAYRLSVCPSD